MGHDAGGNGFEGDYLEGSLKLVRDWKMSLLLGTPSLRVIFIVYLSTRFMYWNENNRISIYKGLILIIIKIRFSRYAMYVTRCKLNSICI